jgi:hypothetical protein
MSMNIKTKKTKEMGLVRIGCDQAGHCVLKEIRLQLNLRYTWFRMKYCWSWMSGTLGF